MAGDPIDSTPLILPFTHPKSLDFTWYLSKLEMCVFGSYAVGSKVPKSIGSLALDEASLQVDCFFTIHEYLQSSSVIIEFTKVLAMASDFATFNRSKVEYTSNERSISRNMLFEMIEECVTTFETASQEIYDRSTSIDYFDSI